jgi:hypothetical protein
MDETGLICYGIEYWLVLHKLSPGDAGEPKKPRDWTFFSLRSATQSPQGLAKTLSLLQKVRCITSENHAYFPPSSDHKYILRGHLCRKARYLVLRYVVISYLIIYTPLPYDLMSLVGINNGYM